MRKVIGAVFATLFVIGISGAANAAGCNYGKTESSQQSKKDELSS